MPEAAGDRLLARTGFAAYQPEEPDLGRGQIEGGAPAPKKGGGMGTQLGKQERDGVRGHGAQLSGGAGPNELFGVFGERGVGLPIRRHRPIMRSRHHVWRA